MKINMYTDGSSRGNPGPGGWAAVLITEHGKQVANSNKQTGNEEDEVIELGGREDMTTNNRMELRGTIMGLRAISKKQSANGEMQLQENDTLIANSHLLTAVEGLTDSEYVRKGITEWIGGWIKKGWKTSAKKDVLNKDLWEELLHEETRLKESGVRATWKYVPGHAGVAGNERADTIATSCADDATHLQLYRGSRSLYPYF